MDHHFILNRGKNFADRYKNLKYKKASQEIVQAKIEKAEKDDEIIIQNDEKQAPNCDKDYFKVDNIESDRDSLLSFEDNASTPPDSPQMVVDEPNSCTNNVSSFEKEISIVTTSPTISCETITECDLKPKEVTVKFRYNSKIYRISLGYSDFLYKYRRTISKTLGVNLKTHQLRITHNDKFLTFDETPEKLGITVADILDCYTKEIRSASKTSKTSPQSGRSSEPVNDPNKIRIKFRNNKAAKNTAPVVCNASKDGSLATVMEEYSRIIGHPMEQLIFEFDGDRLSGQETPIDLDMEDESLVDVLIK